MQPLPIISGAITCMYGLLNAVAGFSQMKAKKIQPWSAWLMLGTGLMLIISGVILVLKLPFALLFLIIGLITIHLLTINNGFYLYGRINIGHHLLRFVVSIILFGLALWSRR